MKFTPIFLTGAALAHEAIVFMDNHLPQQFSYGPGTCVPIYGTIIKHVFTTPDIGLKFYTGYDCDGEKVATSNEYNFKPTGELRNIQSVKVVSRHELIEEEASYYIYWGRY
jgi:hypothetical protein